MEKPNQRFALFAMNIFGDTGSVGIPVLIDLFTRLADHFEITIYLFQKSKGQNLPSRIRVRNQVMSFLPGRIRYALTVAKFYVDHLLSRYNFLFAVSAYPTGLWAVRAAKLTNLPVVLQYIALEAVALHDIKAGNLSKPWLSKITRYVSERADYLVTVSDYQNTMAQKQLGSKCNFRILPLRIEPMKFKYKNRQIELPVRFIQVAYFSPVKDQETMFRAFEKVARKIDCSLTVVGGGFSCPEVDLLLENLGIKEKVVRVGIVSQSELPNYLDGSHILLHTARFETGCAVIQEAMASGVAVCGTRVGLLSDIGDDYAVICPPQNPEMLAEAILSLVHDQEKYDRLTRCAFEWISRYDGQWSFENYVALLTEASVSGKANKLN